MTLIKGFERESHEEAVFQEDTIIDTLNSPDTVSRLPH